MMNKLNNYKEKIINILRKIWCFLFHEKLFKEVRIRFWYGHLAGAEFECPKCKFKFYHSNLKEDKGWHFSPTKDESLTWENN